MPNFTIGLDLGQTRDYSALVVAERLQIMEGRSEESTFDGGCYVVDIYHVRHVQRFELGTPYYAVVDAVSELIEGPGLRGSTLLVFDRTGVGGAVADLFTQAYIQGRMGPNWPLGVTLTAGFSRSGGASGGYQTTAHKGDLVQRLYRLLETDHLKIPLGLPLADQLTKEIRAFRPKQNRETGHLSFEAERESDHDDLVIALALAVWHPHVFAEPRQLGAPAHS